MVQLLQPDEVGPDTPIAVMADGRVWGPFENEAAAERWKTSLDGRAGDLVQAKDVWEGAVYSNDAYYLISGDAIDLGMHPYREIFDIHIADDNGRVVFEMPRSAEAVDGSEAILAVNAVMGRRHRKLPSISRPPEKADLDLPPQHVLNSRDHGQIVVMDVGDLICVGWRKDSRVKKDIRIISGHTHLQMALAAAEDASVDFVPPPKKKNRANRDYQREAVYRWEHKLGTDFSWLTSIDECRDFGREICDRLGVQTPPIQMGRANLVNHSYFKPTDGIVLCQEGMNTHTVIHELAHYVVHLGTRGKRSEPSHGPKFTGTLAGMLCSFANGDLRHVLSVANAEGIDFDETAAVEIIERCEGSGPQIPIP